VQKYNDKNKGEFLCHHETNALPLISHHLWSFTMNTWNHTNKSDFILLGLTDSKEIQLVLSVVFLLIYMVTVLGNICMKLIICVDSQLYTPIYFFLIHLSFLDLSCFTQLYIFILLAAIECFLLCSMAYDRYIAICKHLHYPTIMSSPCCLALLTGSYMIGTVDSSAGSTILGSLITVSVSYVSILSTILKINSTSGKHKAFSIYASHLPGVTVFYSSLIFTYLKPSKSYSLGKDQVASVFYTIVIPMLNSFVVSGTK
ncbi:hypothetical protein U0070_003758, partial [Myodes glareolus]